VTATRDATPTINERGERTPEHDAKPESPFDPPRERFETRGELGRGGMGRVADAYDRALDRPVAIKEMLSANGVDLVRFEREARITARLEHPGIVPIHDAGRTADGTPFYVMRRIDGRPLDQLIAAGLDARLALIPNVLAACDAVAFAHARGVIHRDIKPTNILVGPFGETLVIDWGLARELASSDGATTALPPSDPKLTRAGTVAGTPGFMSPEQARGETVDARADVFALGATLFFVLAGQLPYGGSSATEMVDLAGAGREPDWRKLPRDAPPELRAITKKAMAMKTGERYPDAGALAADLRHFITGNLVGAYDYGLGARLARFVRRHRAAVAVAAISAVIVIVGAVVAVRNVVAERDGANAARARAQLAADRLLVQHARSLAETDPVAAVMALRSVVMSPEAGRAAWPAAEAAAIHGVPVGYSGPKEGFPQISRDGKRVLLASRKDDAITIVDLEHRTRRRVIVPDVALDGVAWLGPDHAVIIGHPTLVIDLRTGATRSLGFDANMRLSDRDHRVWFLTYDARVVAIDGPDDTPRQLATDVTDVYASDDLSVSLFAHGKKWELRTADTSVKVPIETYQAAALVTNDCLVIHDTESLHFWRIDHGRPVDGWTFTTPHMLGVAVAGEDVFVATPRGTVTLRDGKVVTSDGVNGTTFPMPHGFVQVLDSGSLRVRDEFGWIPIQRTATGISHVDVSPDGRTLVATTPAGEVLAWDLRALAPRRYVIPAMWTPLEMRDNAVWLWNPIGGAARLELSTGKFEIVLDRFDSRYVVVDSNERWVLGMTADGAVTIVDRTTGVSAGGGTAQFCFDDGVGVTIVRADGSIERWRPGGTLLHPAGSFGAKPKLATAFGAWAVALVGDQLVRIDQVTGSVERIPAVPHTVVVQSAPDGTVWTLADHVVWSWRPRTHYLTRVPVDEPVDEIAANDDGLMMSSTRAITSLYDDTLAATPVQLGLPVYVSRDREVVVSARNEVSVIDLRSGFSFTLPERPVLGGAVANHERIAFIPDAGEGDLVLSVWELTVPSAPLALGAWLGTITNARPAGDSEIYSWP